MSNGTTSLFVKLGLIAGCLLISACSDRKNISPFPSISSNAQASLGAQVNCATAPQDIKTLEEERASVGKRILSGVRSVFPIAAVAGLLTGDYSDRVQVASGQYNDDINNKIAEIKSTCGIQ
ncbi:MAG: hypothetical protein J0M12_03525 [Deltaproteobacteria bacterium]|nr:hypothetical protein [Deltaproteobacteria bacterium]